MKINEVQCPNCGSSETSPFKCYHTIHNGARQLLLYKSCNTSFSETSNTAMENIKSPISNVAAALMLRSEGLGLRATSRVLQSNKFTISEWDGASQSFYCKSTMWPKKFGTIQLQLCSDLFVGEV